MKKGLISMVPNILPILIIMGLMGFLEVPLDINSLIIGSIAIGLVVDDTVHFMYNLQKYYNLTGIVQMSVQATSFTGRDKPIPGGFAASIRDAVTSDP